MSLHIKVITDKEYNKREKSSKKKYSGKKYSVKKEGKYYFVYVNGKRRLETHYSKEAANKHIKDLKGGKYL